MAKKKYPPTMLLDRYGEPRRSESGNYGMMGASKKEANVMVTLWPVFIVLAVLANILVLASVFG
jgi:hypothetical protein